MGFRLIEDRKRRTIAISHRQYIETILARFNLTDAYSTKLPLDPSVVLSKTDAPSTAEEAEEMKRTPYRELTGALLWISLIAHLDIAFAAAHLAQFNSNPSRIHWEAAKRVLRYLSGMRDHCLVLGRDPDRTNTWGCRAVKRHIRFPR